MTFNVYKELKQSIASADVHAEYKAALLKGVENSLKTISGWYTERIDEFSIEEYNVLLEETRENIKSARGLLYNSDKWMFDYISHERYIIGALKQVMWARMDYEDVKKVRNAHKQEF